MPEVALKPEEIERHRRDRARRLAVVELPLVRVAGSFLLSIAVFLHNHYLLGETSLRPWAITTLLVAAWAAMAWALLVAFYRHDPPRDLTVPMFVGDLVVWTIAIYFTGAEQSWIFFVLLMRVADQVQTTFRRALAFALLSTFCYSAMLGWVVLVDGRSLSTSSSIIKAVLLLMAGLYISISARTAEARRAQLTNAIRIARESILKLEEQSSELKDARARADEANAAKSDFLANMSHEMRTPLHGVIGMLQLAIDGESSPQRLRQLDMARRSAESLLGTIDDILDFARMEARKFELEPVYFSLRDLMVDTMKPLGVTAAGKGLALAYHVDGDVPDSLWADPLRLRQILINLVGNAIKFTSLGEIAVRVSRARIEETKLQLRFEVRDTGVGIDPSKQQAIFDPFMQGEPGQTGGTGLGLSIVARLVEAMGGAIDVSSQPGRGSAFAFTIATETDFVAAIAQRQSWESALVGLSILVVDPNDCSRTFMAEVLRSRGVFATACATHDEAPRGRWACVIAHVPREGSEPLVLISSPFDAARDERLRVTRPVGERELIDAVGAALGLRVAAPALVLDAPIPSERSLRVLVAEDNLVNQEFARATLKKLGHETTVASNGEEALELLKRERFDVVLMDVQMPGLDGLEVTRRFRANESGRRTPIIALTAHTQRDDRERCLDAGMDAVLAKPIDRRQIAELLRGHGTPRHQPRSASQSDPLISAVGGNLELLARVSRAFAQQTPPLIATMRTAVSGRDGETFYQAAHKLKGSVSNFPETEAVALAVRMEECARGRDFEAAEALLPALEAAVLDLGRRLHAAAAG